MYWFENGRATSRIRGDMKFKVDYSIAMPAQRLSIQHRIQAAIAVNSIHVLVARLTDLVSYCTSSHDEAHPSGLTRLDIQRLHLQVAIAGTAALQQSSRIPH